ncbi:glycosyltransferase family 2 protein [uncultured Psychroserpens sp.]|uniref:glycosyltransferase family 2 protein n=1 Tax=uncultured Psychroserpens sp. TaxID=255436 RepID=UPI002615A9B0|nr:glycosyltransferase family 2 protein [uncultured Psychroserpens sp.]
MTPTVSIIIPTYNRVHIIDKALNSIIDQTYSNWECIVVDDGSTDDSLNLLEQFHKKDQRISYYKRERAPKGAPTCRNIGLEHAHGDYVIFLDSDDYLMPFCLQQRVDQIQNHQDHDFLVFPMGMKGYGKVTKKGIEPSDSYLIDFLSFKLAWSIMCPIWKRSFLKMLNGYTEGYPRFNDPELMIRALIQDEVKFKVCHDLDYDTVYVPAEMDKKIYKDKVYKSLKLFIPDICKTLDDHKKSDHKKHLLNYLLLWFKSFYLPLKTSRLKESLDLIKLFRKQGVLSFSKSLKLKYNLLGYSFYNYFFQRFRNRLRRKTFYN